LIPSQLRAGMTIDTGKVDDDGRPILSAKYTGLRALRHFYASWCIYRVADGGLGLPLQVVQERMGHASVVMTSDVYGHLFPRGDDGQEMEAAEKALFG
jgi:integrase